MSKKKILFTIGDSKISPQLPGYKKSDWYNILIDIDKPDKSDKELSIQSNILDDCFSGYASPVKLEVLLRYWINKRDEIVIKMEKGNWSSKSLIGINMCTDIIRYDRACLISIKKYREHQKLFIQLSNQEGSSIIKKQELSSIAKKYEPHFGFPVMNKVIGDLLINSNSKDFPLKNEDMAVILKKDQAKMKVSRCPHTPWKNITILFIHENEFHIKYKDNVDVIKPDKKNSLLNSNKEYSETYTTLLKFAIHKGIINRQQSLTINKKNIWSLRDWLREYTGREDNPITTNKEEGYICQFTIDFPRYNPQSKNIRSKEQNEFDLWKNNNKKWKNIKEY